ncbi:MAG: glucose 1-dehydrogenase [Candidatus Heimdallarchaeota archaeon]
MSKFGYVPYVSNSLVSEKFAAGIQDGKLLGTRCTACKTIYFPPRAHCTSQCLSSDNIEWLEIDGKGIVVSISTVYVAPAGLGGKAPYTLCLVELVEGGRALAWMREGGEQEIGVGEEVVVVPEITDDGQAIYKVLPPDEATQAVEVIEGDVDESLISKKLEGKVAIITGAGRGIGREVAGAFSKQGASVVLTARTEAQIKEVEEEIRQTGGKALAVPCDVSKEEDVKGVVQETLQEFGKIDILVNNAGISWSSQLVKMTNEQWNTVIDVNLKGAFLFLRAAAPHMMELKPRGAKIINFTSTAAKYGNPGQANYAASKWGIIALTKVAAREFASYKINVNALMPGFIETSMTADTPAHYKEQTVAQIPLARTGTPNDVVSAAIFLASSDSDYITGSIIQVDGGLRM